MTDSYIGVPPKSGFINTAKQRVTSSTNNYVDLDHAISDLSDVIVWVNSVKQDSTNLSLTNPIKITLGGTLTASDVVEIVYLGKQVATQSPDTGSVTNSMLAGSIAQDKLSNEVINEAKMQISNSPVNGYMLTAQSGNTGGLTWAEAPSGKFTVVRSAAFSSGDAYMEMTNAFNSTYRNYYVKMEQLKPSSDGADLEVKFGQSDGTYSNVFNYGVRMFVWNNSESYYGGTNVARFTPTFSMDNGAWHNVELYVYDPMSTTDGKHQYLFHAETKRYDQEFGATFGGGMAGVSAALPRLRVGVSSGNFSEGRITVYGITNTGNV